MLHLSISNTPRFWSFVQYRNDWLDPFILTSFRKVSKTWITETMGMVPNITFQVDPEEADSYRTFTNSLCSLASSEDSWVAWAPTREKYETTGVLFYFPVEPIQASDDTLTLCAELFITMPICPNPITGPDWGALAEWKWIISVTLWVSITRLIATNSGCCWVCAYAQSVDQFITLVLLLQSLGLTLKPLLETQWRKELEDEEIWCFL